VLGRDKVSRPRHLTGSTERSYVHGGQRYMPMQ
jgi:hypothetical protein